MADARAVTIDLNGPRTLLYNMAAYKRLRAHGINLLTPNAEDQTKAVDAEAATTILWCGLVDADRAALSLEDVDNAVVLADLPRLVDAIGEALRRANETEVPPNPLATGTPTPTP